MRFTWEVYYFIVKTIALLWDWCYIVLNKGEHHKSFRLLHNYKQPPTERNRATINTVLWNNPRWQSIKNNGSSNTTLILIYCYMSWMAEPRSSQMKWRKSVSSLLSMNKSQKPAWIENLIACRSTSASTALTSKKMVFFTGTDLLNWLLEIRVEWPCCEVRSGHSVRSAEWLYLMLSKCQWLPWAFRRQARGLPLKC